MVKTYQKEEESFDSVESQSWLITDKIGEVPRSRLIQEVFS